MALAFPTPHGGVSRRVLARSPQVRRLTGVVFLVGAVIVTPSFLILDVPIWRGIPATVVALVAGALVLTQPSPAIDTLWNHLLLVAAYAVPVFAYWGALPHAGAVTSAFTFTGALVAFRLSSRKAVAAHMAAVVVLLLVPLALGLADAYTLLAVLILTPAIAALAAIVILVLEAAEQQGDQLERLVRRDPLTGVGNRRLLSERLDYEVVRAGRTGQPFALLALDLNGFKHINDTLGHAAGDELLVAVASTLRESVRAGDTIVRQGGDEFCVLLPETSAAAATAIGGLLRDALGQIVAGERHLTTGLGIAEFPRDGADLDAILRYADTRLRSDKLSSGGPPRGAAPASVG